MTMITQTNRARFLWVLVAITAAYGLMNVLMFYTTDSFGPVWFATSLAVYGMLLAAAAVLAIIDTGPQSAVPDEVEPTEVAASLTDEVAASPPGGLELLDEEVLYEVATGKLVRARFNIDGAERSLLFAITPDEVLPLDAVEDRLDAVDLRVPPDDPTELIEQALERRAGNRVPDPEDRETATTPEQAASTIEVAS